MVAVDRDIQRFLGVRGPGEKGKNILCVLRQGDVLGLRARAYGDHVEGCHGVRAARRGVTGIAYGGRDRSVIGEGVVVDLAVIQAQIYQQLAIGRPGVAGLSRAGGQLLRVHPIEGAVEDILASVGGEPLRLAVVDVYRVEIVVLHERYLHARGREHYPGLGAAAFSQRFQFSRV